MVDSIFYPGNFLNISTTYANTGSGYVLPSAVAKAGCDNLTKSLGQYYTGDRFGTSVCISDNYMMGAKMKNWDEEDSENDSVSELEVEDEDED